MKLALKICACGKKVRPQRRKCFACSQRAWRESHPVRAMFHKVKWSATKRGIVFAMTFADFCLFDDLNDYVSRVGISAESITIDRINPALGYSLDNCQVLPKSENSSKDNQFRRYTSANRKVEARAENSAKAGQTKNGN